MTTPTVCRSNWTAGVSQGFVPTSRLYRTGPTTDLWDHALLRGLPHGQGIEIIIVAFPHCWAINSISGGTNVLFSCTVVKQCLAVWNIKKNFKNWNISWNISNHRRRSSVNFRGRGARHFCPKTYEGHPINKLLNGCQFSEYEKSEIYVL